MNRRTFLQSLAAILPASLAARLPLPSLAAPEAVAPVVFPVTPALAERMASAVITDDPYSRGVHYVVGHVETKLKHVYFERGVKHTVTLLVTGETPLTTAHLERLQNGDYSVLNELSTIEERHDCELGYGYEGMSGTQSLDITQKPHYGEYQTFGGRSTEHAPMWYGDGYDTYDNDDSDDDSDYDDDDYSEPYDW